MCRDRFVRIAFYNLAHSTTTEKSHIKICALIVRIVKNKNKKPDESTLDRRGDKKHGHDVMQDPDPEGEEMRGARLKASEKNISHPLRRYPHTHNETYIPNNKTST